jgi:hypothetical protein
VEETTVDKQQAEATMADKRRVDATMVNTTTTHNTQHACCMLAVLAFFHPLIISIPLTLNNVEIDGRKMFRLFVAEL